MPPGQPAVPPISGLSSARRASSAPRSRTTEPPPLITPRNKKASRSLFREIRGTVETMHHSRVRCERVLAVVMGVRQELENSLASAERTLQGNPRMVAVTRSTSPGRVGVQTLPKSPTKSSPVKVAQRRLTEEELREVSRDIRRAFEKTQNTADEFLSSEAVQEDLEEEAEKVRGEKKMQAETSVRRMGACNIVIVNALQKLKHSSKRNIVDLVDQERLVIKQIEELDLVIELLNRHKNACALTPDWLGTPFLRAQMPWGDSADCNASARVRVRAYAGACVCRAYELMTLAYAHWPCPCAWQSRRAL